MKILIVEDSPRLLRSLGTGLRRAGYTTDMAADGIAGLGLARANDYDAIVLDLLLPGLDGLSLLRQLRSARRDTPVLILSARGEIADRVHGLQLGADDYLVKPFAFDELQARLGSLVRRRYQHRTPEIQLGPILIDLCARQVLRDDKPVDLTRSEYSILEYLALSRGRIRTKHEIAEMLGDVDSCPGPNGVEVLVCTLRRKITAPGEESVIRTRRGFGYVVS